MASPHTPSGLTRRGFNHLALGAGAVTAIGATAACAVDQEEPPQETASGPVELNFIWWGDASRAEVTEAALDIYREAHPDVTITTEYQDSGPYKDKLATRIAAGDPPDLMAMRRDQLREYGDRGALVDLNGLEGLDVSEVPDGAIEPWTIDDALLGVPAGLNTIGFIVQTTVLDEHGIDLPDGDTWTWDDLKTFADSITAATGGAVYGTGFEVATIANLYVYVRQQGEDLYTEDGKLGASVATMQGWFEMIQSMRASGGFPPAGFFEDVGGGAEASYTAQGKLASEIIPTNNFKAYNEACGGTLALLRIPSESTAERRGQSIDCAHLWSIASDSPNQAAAADLLNFLTNDLSAWQAMQTTRGVPPNAQIADDLMADLPEDDVTASEYLMALSEEDLPPAFADPVGATEVQSLLADISTEVEFERLTPADGAQQFVDEANAVLG